MTEFPKPRGITSSTRAINLQGCFPYEIRTKIFSFLDYKSRTIAVDLCLINYLNGLCLGANGVADTNNSEHYCHNLDKDNQKTKKYV